MNELTPKRCPFLQGDHYSKRFENTDKNKKFDFRCQLSSTVFNQLSDYPNKKGCLNGEYLKCQEHSQRTFELSLTIPLHCPLIIDEDKCEITGESCWNYWINYSDNMEGEDYRECQHFSKWFWEKPRR